MFLRFGTVVSRDVMCGDSTHNSTPTVALRPSFPSFLLGRECWLNGRGGRRKLTPPNKNDGREDWDSYVGYELNPPRKNRSETICHYMAKSSEKDGLRVYLDWVFHVHYRTILSRFALAQDIEPIRERTRVVCYEDLVSHEKGQEAARGIVSFLLNNGAAGRGNIVADSRGLVGAAVPADEPKSQTKEQYRGGHATSQDKDLREKLKKLIEELDAEHYDGDIAWLDSVLPC